MEKRDLQLERVRYLMSKLTRRERKLFLWYCRWILAKGFIRELPTHFTCWMWKLSHPNIDPPG